jgi:hypothetical protein
MKPDPMRPQEFELPAQPPLVQGPVGSFDGIAFGAQDQRQRQHSAAADAAEEIGPPLIRHRSHVH